MHTTSRTKVGLAIVALGAVLLAASTQPLLRAEMQETAKPEIAAQNVPTPAVAGEKPCAGCGEKRTADRGTLPYLCTHFPIMYFDEIALFEAERHEVPGCTSPQVDYAYGPFAWPTICPDCDIPGCSELRGSEGFGGLSYAIPHDYEHLLPRGKARNFSRPTVTFPSGFNRFLEFHDVNGKPRPVKVFQYECDLGLASSKPSYKRTMTIALECQRPPGGTFQSIPASDCVPLPDRCNPENCYAYRLTYQSTKILAVVVGD